MKILAVSGSLRSKSYNRGLVRAALELTPQELEIEIFDLSPIPLYNGDVEARGFPEAVEEFRQKINQADGILIATPEYNFSISGVLKNAIDWASRRPNVLDQKPIAIMGATPGGFGTVRAQLHLRTVLQELNVYTMPKPEVYVSRARTKFDANSDLKDEETRQRIQDFLAAFLLWIKHFEG